MPKIHDGEEGGGNTSTSTSTSTRTEMAPRSKLPAREILTVSSGPDEGRVYMLRSGETWIGRSDDCEVVLLASGVSRRHASIIVTQSRVSLRENQAKNGTFVNDQPIVGEVTLNAGDEIRLGSVATLVYARVRGLADVERKKSRNLANMVAGVAHQINTPLGVTQTASALIESLAEELRRDPNGDRVAELLGDLRASAGVVSRNVERTHELVKSFKQLSASELVGDRRDDDLAAILTECVDAARPAAERMGITLTLHGLTGKPLPWVGFSVSMCKVVEHLLQNSLRYAYRGKAGGNVDIRLKSGKAQYRLELEDYGVGIAPSILERLFEPFVTSDREGNADGLGLAVVHMIVTTLFGGTISCQSVEGQGTRFVVLIPFVAPTGT